MLVLLVRISHTEKARISPPTQVVNSPKFTPQFDLPESSRTMASTPRQITPIPPAPAWERHLPSDLPTRTAFSRDADFRGQLLTQSHMDSRSLVAAVFAGAECLQATFEKSDLSGADFRGADLSQAHFAGADLTDARFDEARIHQTYFVGVDSAAVAGKTRVRNGITEPVPPPPLLPRGMGKASFANTHFSQVTLDGLNLAGANFSGATFQGVSFRKADLRRVDFRSSSHASSDFTDALLDGADLRGANLSSATNLTRAQLTRAVTDQKTLLPPQ